MDYIVPPSSPMVYMAEQIFGLGKSMLEECKSMIHTDYPDITTYQKEFEMRWKRGIELIEMAEKFVSKRS